ncbi:hypothetical protein Pmani_027272 [Petrolisthes manimaculis]|uniref:PIN domain-containing protein n=1 Tax=Petrolisthes manimaculis TaxID=1843537 RepID=A0AAE1P2H5_9EUCA|nr:hypothetical protein Pmani_027272 [Petrolisthes manimaculis]
MKRTTLTTGERADHLDQIKKLNKHVSECVRRANASLGEAGTVGALFSPQGVGVRVRLKEACERVMLAKPGSHARPVEDILWRKVYYEPLTAAKKMKKGSSWSSSEALWIEKHLWDGVAYYHQLLHSQSPTHPHILTPDLLPVTNDECIIAGEGCNQESIHRYLTCLADLTRYMLDLPSPPPPHLPARYYLQALHYQPEGGLVHSNLATVYTSSDQPLLAVAHNLRALTCDKSFESAEGNLKRLLEKSRTIYESNGEDSKEQMPAHRHYSLFLHSLLTLVSCFIHNRSTEDVARVCQDVLVRLSRALETCDDPDTDTSDCAPSPAPTSSNGHVTTALQNGRDSPGVTEEKKPTHGFLLTPNAVVIVCAVLSLCIKRLQKQGSHMNMAQALLVSVLMTLISHVTSRLEQRISLVDPSFLSKLLPKEDKKNVEENDKDGSTVLNEKENNSSSHNECVDTVKNNKSKKKKSVRNNRLAGLRRRRVNGDAATGSDDEHSSLDSSSDEDDKENDDELILSSDDEEIEEEEDLDISHLCSSEDDDSDEDVKVESEQEWTGLSTGEHLELIGQEGMLGAVLVGCWWLRRDNHAIHLCLKTADALWTALAKLLNLIRLDFDQLSADPHGIRQDVISLFQDSKQAAKATSSTLADALLITPLPEDLMLHTLIPSFLPPSPKALNLKSLELVLLRVKRLHDFGEELSSRCDTPLWRSSESHLYTFSMEGVVARKDTNKETASEGGSRESSASPTEDELLMVPQGKKDSRRLAGMQSLTAQWLQHEVRSLEERTARRATLGLYLVPDATVLTNHLHAIKLLLAKPTHMIIIPQAVIDLLDQQKRESVGARDAIRWLEIKFQHGSRFIRSQRQHERTHLPLIKYPRRKDKEAWEWYQIVECCHYLSAQVQQNSSNVKAATVTLLTGEKHTTRASFSHSGITHAAGAVLEHIEEFMRKWQTSTKGHS